ncbi:endonuclease/exonuclease/phosphatase family metal-dependent hydrolase [Frondihabitans sp. PhB188]|uniref:endonuclease/exonuclease/phosphatase family protein n=1 Tax=Frondihabitans sp. PhB188 TaxID=2485200 RepID=UPI000F490685|nr:endonuclease/exonuclease/phosphatase family protein [Frondihabitans sp. PhB188]ROQ40706.1 endonuclease/exonuclease/phosphatase family metal-dependent hydrolase [Frondihabitans sp. PhB188]
MTHDEPLVGAVKPPAVHLMTLNVRRRMPRLWPSPAADRWSHRRQLMQTLLRRERPGILGVQEALPDQADAIGEMLGSSYASVGGGRGRDGRGERCVLFVDTARFVVQDSSTWWLSATPTRAASRSFGNRIPRIVTQATLADRVSGSPLTVFVTHFDHLSARSRLRSARMLSRSVEAVEGPVVVLGDFNADADSAPHRALTAGGVLVDAFDVAERRLSETRGTFSRYGAPQPHGRRLDWILTDPSAVVSAAGVNAGWALSDHDPVHAVVTWRAM